MGIRWQSKWRDTVFWKRRIPIAALSHWWYAAFQISLTKRPKPMLAVLKSEQQFMPAPLRLKFWQKLQRYKMMLAPTLLQFLPQQRPIRRRIHWHQQRFALIGIR